MNKKELIELLQDYHDLDEVCLCSPGGKTLVILGLDFELISKTGRIVLATEWGIEDGATEQLRVNPHAPYERKKKRRKPGPKKSRKKKVVELSPINALIAATEKRKRGRPKKNPEQPT